jgi:hypothetical protein
VSDLTGTIGIDSREQLTEELVRIEGERSRLMMAQGKAVLTDCAALLKQAGQPEVQLMQRTARWMRSWQSWAISV